MKIQTVIKTLILILLLMYGMLPAQSRRDSLRNWISGFHQYSHIKSTPDGNWFSVRKAYPGNPDTLLVYSTREPQNPRGSLRGFNHQQYFLGNTHLLASGQDDAVYVRLSDFSKVVYKDIRKIAVQPDANQYSVLDKQNVLCIYRAGDSQKILAVPDVSDILTDHKGKIWAVQQSTDSVKIISPSLNRVAARFAGTLLYSELLPSGKYWSLTVRDGNTNSIKPVIVTVATGKAIYAEQLPFREADFVKVTEVNRGNSFFLNYEKKIKDENHMVDVWSSADTGLKDKKWGVDRVSYYIWTPGQDPKPLLAEGFSALASADRQDLFLAFNTVDRHNYRYPATFFDVYLYSAQSGESKLLSASTKNIAVAPGGAYIAAQNGITGNWVLFDVRKMDSREVGGESLAEPVFSENGRELLFSSENGFWKYDLHSHRLIALPGATGNRTSFVLPAPAMLYEQKGVSFRISTANFSEGLVIRTYDASAGRTGYLRWNGKNVAVLRPETENHIREANVPSGRPDGIFTVEEFYNRPPQLLVHRKGQMRNTAVTSASQLSARFPVKREIITFTGPEGQPLKAVLFYPKNYTPHRKYPMVVRVYQRQFAGASKYLYPSFDEDGFNVRLLLENGYFVYLPDTVTDSKGSSFSALQCVHSALDGIASNNSVDFKRVGLTGHSFGGYETNFIATRSHRFAAYISGAGISNITARYFAYNRPKSFAEYARIETGQYAMGPFTESKDLYSESNPVYHSEKVNAPILLWTGTRDTNVPPDQTMAYFIGLMRNRKTAVALFYKDVDHTFIKGSPQAEDLMIRSLDWWDYWLKDRKDISWIVKQLEHSKIPQHKM